MSGIYADTSNMQVANFTDLVVQINFFIIQNAAFRNHAAVAELVEQFEEIMEPYKDKKYEEEIKGVVFGDSNPNTPNELRQIHMNNERNMTSIKRRALMKLAYRRAFLPSAATGKGGMESEHEL